jgi:hypothetical protein
MEQNYKIFSETPSR